MRKVNILNTPFSMVVVVVVIEIDDGLDSIDVVTCDVLLVTILLLLMSVAGV